MLPSVITWPTYERREAPKMIALEDLRLRECGFDDPSLSTSAAREDALRSWTRVLELSLLFSTVEEATLRLGLQNAVDVLREVDRVHAFVVNVSRLDVQRVFEENHAILVMYSGVPSHADTPSGVDMDRVLRAVQSLLVHCPVEALEETAHRLVKPDLRHRCRLAFDGLKSFVARNSHPHQQAIAASGQAYAEGRLTIQEVAAVLDLAPPDAVALLEEHGFRRSTDRLRLSDEARQAKLAAIHRDRLARGDTLPERPDLVAREVVASQRIEDIDARPWLRP